MNKRTFKTAFLFSAVAFLILLATLIIMSVLTLIGVQIGWLNPDRENNDLIIIIFSLVSIVVGSVVSRIVIRRALGKIMDISEASMKVAKGDFSVQINENMAAEEVKTAVQNFNLMVRELASTEMMRSDFIENVSHEFKTPLSAIEGYATLLQSKNISEEKREEYTAKILANTKRLSALTGNILLLSRIENQELEIKKEPFPLDEQIRETVLLFQDSWDEKQLELDIELDSVSYNGSRELLSHVWQNIFGNAVKFTDKGGCVKVRLSCDGENVYATFKDNGVGMDGATLERIYEKFYQGDSSHSGAGNGLGMALAKRIVDLHGGEIFVESHKGEGSEFTVTLPVNK